MKAKLLTFLVISLLLYTCGCDYNNDNGESFDFPNNLTDDSSSEVNETELSGMSQGSEEETSNDDLVYAEMYKVVKVDSPIYIQHGEEMYIWADTGLFLQTVDSEAIYYDYAEKLVVKLDAEGSLISFWQTLYPYRLFYQTEDELYLFFVGEGSAEYEAAYILKFNFINKCFQENFMKYKGMHSIDCIFQEDRLIFLYSFNGNGQPLIAVSVVDRESLQETDNITLFDDWPMGIEDIRLEEVGQNKAAILYIVEQEEYRLEFDL